MEFRNKTTNELNKYHLIRVEYLIIMKLTGIETFGDTLKSLSLLTNASDGPRKLSNPSEPERTISKVTRSKRISETIVSEIIKRDIIEKRRHVQIRLTQLKFLGCEHGFIPALLFGDYLGSIDHKLHSH